MNRKGWVGIGVIFFCVVVVVGCKCNGHQERGNVDSLADSSNKVEVTDSFSMDALKQKDSVSIFKNDTMSNALQQLSVQKKSWSNAHLINIDTIQSVGTPEKVQIDNSFLKKYASLLKASPDGQYILDIGSDNMVEDTKTGQMFEGDPETNVAILNKQTGEKLTLIQLGGSGRLLNMHWLDNEQAAILCSLPGKDPKKDETYLYVYNAKDHFMKTYKF